MKTTFAYLWENGLEADAKRSGVIDGDLPKVRSKVKSMLISAGWCTPGGDVEFVSDEDYANCLQRAGKELARVSALVSSVRKAEALSANAGSPTRAQVLAGADVPLQTKVSGGFSPAMGEVGDPCPRCQGPMQVVAIANSRAALYCTRDRVVTPLGA